MSMYTKQSIKNELLRKSQGLFKTVASCYKHLMTDRDISEEAVRGMQEAALNLGTLLGPFIHKKTRVHPMIKPILNTLSKYIYYIHTVTQTISVRIFRHQREEQDAQDSAVGRMMKDHKPKKLIPSKAEAKVPHFNLTLKPTSDYCLVAMWVKDYPRLKPLMDKPFEKYLEGMEAVASKHRETWAMITSDRYDSEKEDRKKKFYDLCCIFRKKVMRLGMMGLTVEEVRSSRPFPKKPFERECSELFLRAARKNDLKTLRELIMISKYLVYAFDWTFLTPLHWAAKRGYYEVIEFLLDHGADIDAEDSIEKSSLWYAMHLNNVECMTLLIKRGAGFPKPLSLKKLQNLKVHPLIIRVAKTLIEARHAAMLYPRGSLKKSLIHQSAKRSIVSCVETSGLFKRFSN